MIIASVKKQSVNKNFVATICHNKNEDGLLNKC